MPSLGRVLIVDDEPEVADMLLDVLSTLGYQADAVGDGPNALRRVAADQPHVVLLDMSLPGMSGIAVLQALSRDHPELPVIMVTANQNEEGARDTLKLGAFDYIRKAFDIERLRLVLEAAMASRPG